MGHGHITQMKRENFAQDRTARDGGSEGKVSLTIRRRSVTEWTDGTVDLAALGL